MKQGVKTLLALCIALLFVLCAPFSVFAQSEVVPDEDMNNFGLLQPVGDFRYSPRKTHEKDLNESYQIVAQLQSQKYFASTAVRMKYHLREIANATTAFATVACLHTPSRYH